MIKLWARSKWRVDIGREYTLETLIECYIEQYPADGMVERLRDQIINLTKVVARLASCENRVQRDKFIDELLDQLQLEECDPPKKRIDLSQELDDEIPF